MGNWLAQVPNSGAGREWQIRWDTIYGAAKLGSRVYRADWVQSESKVQQYVGQTIALLG